MGIDQLQPDCLTGFSGQQMTDYIMPSFFQGFVRWRWLYG